MSIDTGDLQSFSSTVTSGSDNIDSDSFAPPEMADIDLAEPDYNDTSGDDALFNANKIVAMQYASQDQTIDVGKGYEKDQHTNTWMTGPEKVIQPEEEGVSWGESMRAEFRLDNTLASTISNADYDEMTVTPGYLVEDDPAVAGYEQYQHIWGFSVNADMTKGIIENLQRELNDREIRNKSSLTQRMVSTTMAFGLDPVLLPLMFVPPVRGASMARQVAKWSTLDMSAEAAAEIIKHQNQIFRTTDESIANIALAGAFGGILGGGSYYFRSNEEFSKAANAVRDYQTDPHKVIPPAEPTELAPRSAGAAAYKVPEDVPNFEDFAMNNGEAIAFVTQSPIASLSNSPVIEARQAAFMLADSPYYHRGHFEGKVLGNPDGSIEALIKQRDDVYARLQTSKDEMFLDYRGATKKRFAELRTAVEDLPISSRNSDVLTKNQFNEQVALAVETGAKHDIPQVQKAAEQYRKYFDDYLNELVDQGMLPKEMLDQNLNYLHRMYSRDEVIKYSDELESVLTEHYEGIRTAQKVELQGVETQLAKAMRQQDEFAKASKGVDDTAARQQLKGYAKDIKELKAKQAELFGFTSRGAADSRASAISTINNIKGSPLGHSVTESVLEGTSFKAPALQRRSLDIPYDKISKFLERDIDAITKSYTRTIAPKIEIHKALGDVDFSNTATYRDIIGAYDDVRSGMRAKLEKEGKTTAQIDKALLKLQTRQEKDVKNLNAMLEKMQGIYGEPADPSSVMWRASRFIKQYNFTRLLGQMTISALPDLARPIMTQGFSPVARNLRTLGNMKRYGMAIEDVKRAGVAWEAVLNSRSHSLAGITDNIMYSSKLERGMNKLNDVYGKVTLMTPWNDALKGFSGVVVQDGILRAVMAKGAGQASKKQIRDLAKSGINKEMAERINQQFSKHGSKGDSWIANGEAWDDVFAAKAFRSAVSKSVDEIIVTPGIGEMPLWISGPIMSHVTQFKSFAFSANSKILVSGLQAHDQAYFTGLLLSIAIGSSVYGIKQAIRGKEPADDATTWIMEGLDRSGSLGLLNEANNLTSKFSGGFIDYTKLWGSDKPMMSRYQARNTLGTFAGPTGGAVNDLGSLGRLMGSGEEWSRDDGNRMRRLIPFNNALYWNWGLNRIFKD